MSDTAPSAGALLRQARTAQGLHIAALAAQIKVSPRKLEMLEADRFDELPDPTFARALALTVCRALKIDAEPVLSRLPQPNEHRLERVTRGLDTPFRDRPGRQLADERSPLTRPVVWGPALILIAALALYLMPERWTGGGGAEPAATVIAPAAMPTPAAPPEAASAPVAAAPAEPTAPQEPVLVETVPAAPADAAASAPAEPPLVLRTSGASWIEVIDARGRALLARTVKAGETIGLDATPPLKLRIGNAAATQLSYRGEAVDLRKVTRDNVARLELK